MKKELLKFREKNKSENNSVNTPLYMRIYSDVVREIKDGVIKGGDKLPSKRALAERLGVSVITVENAYLQLVSEGYVFSKPGSGYFVEKFYSEEKPSEPVKGKDHDVAEKYDFSTNGVDNTAFPFSVFAKLAREVLSNDGEELLKVSDRNGNYGLRKEISVYLKTVRGIDASPENIVVGAGAEYLLGLIVQLLGRDNAYGVENPGYDKTYKIFSANSSRVFPVPVDDKGACIKAVSGFGVNIIHVTPSHHFPLGIVMPIGRRRELLEWAAEESDRYIIEDDYDSEFRYIGKPVTPLKGLDEKQKVIYVSTFTKSLAQSIRMAFMVLPDNLTEKFKTKLGFYSCTVPVFDQLILKKFISGGYFERHINKMRKIYRIKRDTLIKKINLSELKSVVTVTGEEAGMHLLLTVNNEMDEDELILSAKNEGVKIKGLKSFYSFPVMRAADNEIVIGYAGLSVKEITDGIALLEKAWVK